MSARSMGKTIGMGPMALVFVLTPGAMPPWPSLSPPFGGPGGKPGVRLPPPLAGADFFIVARARAPSPASTIAGPIAIFFSPSETLMRERRFRAAHAEHLARVFVEAALVSEKLKVVGAL